MHGIPARLRPALPLLLLAALPSACDDPTDPGGRSPEGNPRVPLANGIHHPSSCEAPRSSLRLLGRLDLPESLTDVWGWVEPGTGREYALVGFKSGPTRDGGLYVVDVGDPAAPTLVATLEDAAAQDVATWRHYAYTVTGDAGEGELGMVYDLSDPTAPERVGTFESGHNLFVSDRGYLYKAQPGVKAYDLEADPTTPDSVWGNGRSDGHDVAVLGDTLIDFRGFDGTVMYDVGNPFEPDVMAGFDRDSLRYHHSGWTSRDGTRLYVNDELPANLARNADVHVWSIPDRRFLGTWRDTRSTIHNSFRVCDRLVVSYYTQGVRVFDISRPDTLVLLDGFDTDPDVQAPGMFLGAWGVFPYLPSGRILVSDVDKGLYVFALD